MDKLAFLPVRWRALLRAGKRSLVDSGLLRSLREGHAVDTNGRPVPWYTFPAIAYLDRLDLTGLSVFEWGIGASTLYWERRGADVLGVEDSPEWHERVSKATRAQCILAKDQATYVNAPSGRRFHIVAIDGRHRDECASIASEVVADGGLIVFDNSDRHPDALRKLRRSGWIQVDFYGLGPLNAFPTTTSLLFRGTLAVPHPDLPRARY